MADTQRNYSSTAEYFFEYQIEKVFSDSANIKLPGIYFERDYTNQDIPYTVFAVPQEWLGRQEDVLRSIQDNSDPAAVKKALSKLEYDAVKVVFDIKGILCAPLLDENSKNYESAEIKTGATFEQFYQAGCRITIENNNSEDHSGIGVIEMLKNNKMVAKFFFSMNFTFRKKIEYTLETSGDKATMKFVCKGKPVGVSVALVYNKDRLPCLKNDMGVNVVSSFELDFSGGPVFKKTVKLPGEAAKRGNIFSLAIADNSVSKYYLLDCAQNNSLPIEKKEYYHKPGYSCPFCHKKIDRDLTKDKAYKKGGTACSVPAGAKSDAFPTVYMRHKTKLKKCLYCSGDLNPDNASMFKPSYTRLLPPAFMEHNGYKIAFAGSKRAGKTTYISRFFGISGDDKISMPMTMTSNSLNKFGVTVSPASVSLIKKSGGDGYELSDENWTDEHPHYTQRAINLDPPRYPEPTETGEITSLPFIAEVSAQGRRSYVSFYDIAGEDAQHSKQVSNIAGDEVIGVFCIINGKKDVSGNSSVASMLNMANLNKNCPVAVIVTKMDMLEKEFDSNCQCLRSDYFESGRGYSGTLLEKDIDISSEEIRSYLKQMSLLPDIDGSFENVKYFCVSSFNFIDSIHNELEDINTPGKVKFDCSSKRMELPFVWMLKQFGVIK